MLEISGYMSHIKEQGTFIKLTRHRRTGAAKKMPTSSFYTNQGHVTNIHHHAHFTKDKEYKWQQYVQICVQKRFSMNRSTSDMV